MIQPTQNVSTVDPGIQKLRDDRGGELSSVRKPLISLKRFRYTRSHQATSASPKGIHFLLPVPHAPWRAGSTRAAGRIAALRAPPYAGRGEIDALEPAGELTHGLLKDLLKEHGQKTIYTNLPERGFDMIDHKENNTAITLSKTRPHFLHPTGEGISQTLSTDGSNLWILQIPMQVSYSTYRDNDEAMQVLVMMHPQNFQPELVELGPPVVKPMVQEKTAGTADRVLRTQDHRQAAPQCLFPPGDFCEARR